MEEVKELLSLWLIHGSLLLLLLVSVDLRLRALRQIIQDDHKMLLEKFSSDGLMEIVLSVAL